MIKAGSLLTYSAAQFSRGQKLHRITSAQVYRKISLYHRLFTNISLSLTRIKRRQIMQLSKTGHKKPRNNPSNYAQQKVACIERGVMEPFPSTLVQPKRPAKIQRVQLYCDCCLPEDGEEPMAFCQKCGSTRAASPIPDVVFDRTL